MPNNNSRQTRLTKLTSRKQEKEMSEGWSTVESDPAIFTELMSSIGVKGLVVEELEVMDADIVRNLNPLGLIFLFKYTPDRSSEEQDYAEIQEIPDDLFFANQVIENACATQALLAILLNLDTQIPEVNIGDVLTEFKQNTQTFPSDIKGEAISNLSTVRAAHNSFSKPTSFFFPINRKSDQTEDAFHFSSFIPFKSLSLELDGLKDSAKVLDSKPDHDWIDTVLRVIQRRMQVQQEIRFGLLVVRKDPRIDLRSALITCENEFQKAQYQYDIKAFDRKLARWHEENALRRHMFLPLISKLLTTLAKHKVLLD